MKTFAFVLLCALAAVQGRHTALQSTRTAAALGENPWLVHLRIAVATSGLLNTGAGTLIGSRWVLTSAENIVDGRFVWIRYGVVSVINPSLVTEASGVTLLRVHPGFNAATGENNVGLININRNVQSTDNIAPISPVGRQLSFADSSRFCSFGGDDAPGEQLFCFDVTVTTEEDGSITVASDEVAASVFDNGAPLVSDGAQVALLVGPGSDGRVGEFIATADFKDWIEQETGLDLSPGAGDEVAPEAVRFIQ